MASETITKNDLEAVLNEVIPPAFDSWHVKVRTLVSAHSFKGTTANAWEYVGASFTVPIGHTYVVFMQAGYASGKPLGIGINSSSSTLTLGSPDKGFLESANGCNRGIAIVPGGTAGADCYLFCKRGGVPQSANEHYAWAIDIYN